MNSSEVKNNFVKISKYLTFILRHKPDSIDLDLDDSGYASIQDIITKTTSMSLNPKLIAEVVANDSKQRFSYSPCNTKLRAAQGHSIKVDIGYEEKQPPEILYHGTIRDNLVYIKTQGLKPMSRTHVHLSGLLETAKQVGSRYGKPVILEVRADDAHKAGHKFYIAANGVWLSDHVPAKFIRIPGE